MPSLIDIRRRIRSVKNTQQITKAMKMVSAAKLRRAQERALASRPYSSMLERMLCNVAAAAAGNSEIANLPLLQTREEKRIQILVVSSDSGLAGGFNANLFRTVQDFIAERRGAEIHVEVLGKKGRDYFRRRRLVKITGEHIGVGDKPDYDRAAEIADKMIDFYANAEIDSVYLAVNEFKSVMAPNLVFRKILPVDIPEAKEPVDYIYEQPIEELLEALLPRYVEIAVYRAMLESNSAFQAARMTAMDAASKNAGDVIQDLTLNLNRVRQAAITREIIEIVSGAAAL
jgi:F-type H+-transporting ATPase subunit gamma